MGVKMAVLMPITRPPESMSGPPLLPGLMLASHWMPPPALVCCFQSYIPHTGSQPSDASTWSLHTYARQHADCSVKRACAPHL